MPHVKCEENMIVFTVVLSCQILKANIMVDNFFKVFLFVPASLILSQYYYKEVNTILKMYNLYKINNTTFDKEIENSV